MNEDLDRLREIYLSDDVDEDTRAENLDQIREWEAALTENEALADWKEHIITRQIIDKARQSYLDCALRIQDRTTPQDTRETLWRRQDAMLWLINLSSGDPKAELERLQSDIKTALNTTN